MARTSAWLWAGLCLIAGCGGGSEEPPEEPAPPVETVAAPSRFWSFTELRPKDLRRVIDGGEKIGGKLHEYREVGAVSLALSGEDLVASGEVHSSETGNTWWVEAEAPTANALDPADTIGLQTWLMQAQTYRKRAADATMRLVITEATMEAVDFNGSAATRSRCAWVRDGDPDVLCYDRIWGAFRMDVRIVEITAGNARNIRHHHFNGGAELFGWTDNWDWMPWFGPRWVEPSTEILREGLAPRPLFHREQFEFEKVHGTQLNEPGARLRLKQPVVVDIDLSTIPLNATFGVWVEALAITSNRRGRESWVRARLRDPLSAGGTVIEATGVEQITTTDPREPEADERETPQCSASSTSAQAGTVQFSAADYAMPEFGLPGPVVFVTREGGSEGTLIVEVATRDATAVAGVHYEALGQRLVFHDGDTEPRAIQFVPVDDEVAGGRHSVGLELSAEAGCAVLGARSRATLTIIDDEDLPPPDLHSVGGTLTGLVGSGLVIEEVRSGRPLTINGNGAFVFDYAYPDGASYEVRVASQPTQPAQACAVSAGDGIIDGASVSDVRVDCAPPATGSSLDPGFGDGGRVTAGLTGEGRALALQPDGRILALGRRELARFNADGTLDASFGDHGVASVAFNGVSGEEARDIAVQPDGRIVVAGYTRASATTTNYDFAVLRLGSDGTRDATFDGDGLATIDIDGQVDRAHRVAVLADGRILVGGHAGSVDPSNPGVVKHSFAVARLDASGTSDTSFGVTPPFIGTGHARQLGGGSSLAYAMAIAPDGKIVLGGRVGSDGADPPAAGLARWSAGGVPDTDDDDDPQVWFGVDGGGSGTGKIGGTNVIEDLLVAADGSLYGIVNTDAYGHSRYLLAQFLTPFGTQMGRPAPFLTTNVPIGPGDDVMTALTRQGDGKFIVVGSASSAGTVSDFGIVRFNADRSLDGTFGEGGVLTIDFFGAADGANDVLVQPDGKILVLGGARNGSIYGFALVRLLP